MCGQYHRKYGKVIVKYDEETEELSNDVIEATGKVADLTKVASNNYAGVSLWADAEQTQYRSLVDYLGDISEIWDEIDAKSQTQLLDNLFGKRGASVGSAILLNFDQIKQALIEMEGAAGAADEEMKIIEESWEYKLNNLKQTWIGLIQDLIDRGVMADLIDDLTRLSELLIGIIEANPKGFILFISALAGLDKVGGLRGLTDTISGLGNLTKGIGDFAKLTKGTKEVATATAEASEVLLECGSAGLEMAQAMGTASAAMEGAAGSATVATGQIGGLSGAVSALAGALGVSVGALAAFAALAVAVGVGAVVAWDKFTTTVDEAKESVKESEGKVADLKQKVEELESVENRTSGQEKRLDLLQKQLKTAEDYLEVQKQIEYSERFGNKFSDSFDKENAYTQYRDDLGGRSTTDINQVSHSSYQSEAEDRISYINKYIDDLKNLKEGSDEAIEAAHKLDDEQDKARETLAGYLEETERYYERLNFVKEAIESGYLKEGSREYENAQEMIKGYTQIIGQNEHWIEMLQKAIGDYDYVQDDIKQLASNWETGSISAENIASTLIDKMDGFSEAEKAAFYDSIKNAKSYAEALDIINQKQEEINSSTIDNDSWNKEKELLKFGIDEAAFDKYIATFQELNNVANASEEAIERAAVAHYAFDTAIEDLRSHLNDYEENITTLDRGCIEFGESVKALATDLTALTGIDFSLDDAESFLKDAQNLELLRQALDGDNEALTRLRANAALGVYIHADADLNTEWFNEEYNNLVNFIAANPDIGAIEAQTFLDESPFVQGCIDLVNQGKMTSKQLRDLFASLGWNIDFDERTENIKVPQINYKAQSAYEYAKNAAKKGYKNVNSYQGYVSYDVVPVKLIDNIRFVDKRMATKPTTSSGANYKPSQRSGGGSGGSGGGGGGGSSPKSTDEKKEEKDPTEEAKEEEKEVEDTYDEFFDFFERRLKVVSDAISLLDTNLENVVGSKAKNSLLDAQMRIYKMQQDEYSGAKKMYQEMADRALEKIDDEDIVKRIKNGAIAIDEFIGKGNEEVVNAINDYTKWAEKVADCKEELAKLKEELRQLELERFKNIAQDWQDVFDLRKNNSIDLIDKQIDLIEETGNLVGRSFYETQKQQTQKMLDTLRKEREELVAEMSRGLSNGTIDKGSDEWLEMVNTLSDLEGEIIDTTKGIEELDNSILNIHTEVFERIQDQFSDLDDEISDIVGFLEDAKPGDDFGNWTKEGIAQAGLLAQQYELATKRTQSLSNEISYLKAQYSAGAYSATEYADKLADLTQQQRDSAKAAEDAKKSIISLNKARIDIEIEAIQKDIEQYKKLIDVQKQSLQSQKDLHDYEKNIAGQNRNISDIERRLAAMSGDNTASTIAKRKALEKELSDARMELEETEYDHSITSQQDALDQQAEQYETARQAEIDKLNEYLENETQVLSDTFESVKARALEIGQTIAQTAQEHGIQVSESLTAAWKAGSDAIASYGEVLTPATSEFIAQLEDVEEHTWELQEQADVTSVQLAAMFANRADNLVDELQRSWDSEANLNEMTKALEDSFVHTIDTAGHIGEIVASNMAEAEAATDAVKDAAESAADAFNDMADSARSAAAAAQEAINLQSQIEDTSHFTSIYGNPNSNGVSWDKIGGTYTKNTQKSAKSYSTTIPGLGKKTKKKYARGLSKAERDELAWTQELGDEVIVSPTRNSVLTPIKKNDEVLTAGMTKNLWELAKVDPKQLLEGNGANISAPQIQSNNTSVQIGTLVNVEGSISDDNLTDVKQTVQEELKKTFRNINSGLLR